MTPQKVSPFLYSGPVSKADSLSIIHLKRDLQIPTILKEHDEDDEGYSEGKVVNTRFGSFPHTTLIGLPWGSQVRASKVDTGSRGRRAKPAANKRKRDDAGAGANKAVKLEENTSPTHNTDDGDAEVSTPSASREEKEAVAAATGFIHLLPPTPENWTSSLPHRTQVVYTPDYSYILHRIRARPGKNIIEAGAGSGSFTHASARAVFSGYPFLPTDQTNGTESKKRNPGKVWSYEFHEQRHQKLVQELCDHELEGVVQITHRDVCEDGFLVDGKSPNADCIFLDLPAPWLALPHLVRSKLPQSSTSTPKPDTDDLSSSEQTLIIEEKKPFISPLNPTTPVHICTFSPCIEQVQRTVSALRRLGWVSISTVELSQRRFEIRRERIGITTVERGVQATPSSVAESVARLREVEGNFKTFHQEGENGEKKKSKRDNGGKNPNNKASILSALVERKVYKEGKLVHRTEPEIKTHTSYLTFAVLPVEWSEEDEKRASEKWPVKNSGTLEGDPPVVLTKKQKKKAERQARIDEAAEKEKEDGESAEKENGEPATEEVTRIDEMKE